MTKVRWVRTCTIRRSTRSSILIHPLLAGMFISQKSSSSKRPSNLARGTKQCLETFVLWNGPERRANLGISIHAFRRSKQKRKHLSKVLVNKERVLVQLHILRYTIHQGLEASWISLAVRLMSHGGVYPRWIRFIFLIYTWGFNSSFRGDLWSPLTISTTTITVNQFIFIQLHPSLQIPSDLGHNDHWIHRELRNQGQQQK